MSLPVIISFIVLALTFAWLAYALLWAKPKTSRPGDENAQQSLSNLANLVVPIVPESELKATREAHRLAEERAALNRAAKAAR